MPSEPDPFPGLLPTPPPSESKDCWLVTCWMPEIGHPLAWTPIAVYDTEQQAQEMVAAIGAFERSDGASVPVGRIKKLPRIPKGVSDAT